MLLEEHNGCAAQSQRRNKLYILTLVLGALQTPRPHDEPAAELTLHAFVRAHLVNDEPQEVRGLRARQPEPST